MVNLFDRKKDAEKKPKEPQKKVSGSEESATETRELRQKEFSWATYDTNSKPKSADWYFILWTVAIAGAVAAILLNNILFGLFLVIAAFSVSIYASRKPKLVEFRVSRKGIEADTILVPLSTLSHFCIVEENEPIYLLLQSKKVLSPLHTFPVAPEVDTESLHEFLNKFLEEEVLEIPFSQRIMDRIGF